MNKATELTLLKLADHLITKYGYVRVDVRNVTQEIWLSHMERSEYNLIRLSLHSGFELKKIEERTTQIKAAISSVLQKSLSFLNLEIDEEGSFEDREAEETHVVLSAESSDLSILKDFPDLKVVFSNSEDPQAEAKALQDKLRKQTVSKKPLSFFDYLKSIPRVTQILVLINVILYLIVQALVLKGYDIFASVIMMGAYYKTFILANMEYWRFLTAGFLHMDFFHLLMNMFALINLGNFMERLYGPKKFLITVLSGITVGSFFVFAAEGNLLVIGISGGLYAILGVMLMYLIETGLIKQPAIQSQVIRLVTINILINFLPQISVLGHLGGLVAGALLGLYYSKNKAWESMRKHAFNALILLVLALGAVSFQNTKTKPLYIKTDIWVVEMTEDLGLGWYSDILSKNLETYYQKENAYETQ